MKYINLKNNKFSLVDNEDFEYLNRWKWFTNARGYAYRNTNKNDRVEKRTLFYMHRVIMHTPKELEVDHINGDKLDNRKSNLRICTHEQNSANIRLRSNNTSGYKGVYAGYRGRFRVYLCKNNKYIYGGSFDTKEQAALAYNNIAKRFQGDYACLNKI